MVEIITRSQAIERGLQYYFNGNPCQQGHLAQRRVTGACVECHRIAARKRALERYATKKDACLETSKKWAANNPEKMLAYKRKWAASNGDKILEKNRNYRANNREIILKKSREYYAANIDKERARSRKKHEAEGREKKNRRAREYYAAHPSRSIAISRKWQLSHPEMAKANGRNQRARRKKAEGSHTAADVKAIRKSQKDKCAACKTALKGKGHLDHIKPLSKGGSNWPRNLQWLCATCNLTKRARDPIAFMQSQGFLL